ncbi:uncharacterized protein LOC112121922 [Terrapene carolina triunguis]|uniref:uncharacterized protein LOC112121922 n=1 Tax=Terrapene triunguis TaxID=2587831 RepID=UPI0011566221|nr:uncharacterized protein LOC112121922 [Terrapene carolina triunguis]
MEKKCTVSGCSIPHQVILPFASAASCLAVVLLAHHLFLKKAQGIGKTYLQFFHGTRKAVNIWTNVQTWKELELRLKYKKTIDEEHLRLIKQEEKKNGNFLKFVKYLALFDPLMDEHLRRIKDQEMYVHYLGKDIQNELIQLLSNAIKQKILASAHAAKYFSIILDCTPDAGHVEQMTMITEFVDRPTSETENETESVCIKEHFLGFVSLTETTGAGMTETILHQLEEMSLPIENLCGQGYDNGSNMKGKENGLGDIYDALIDMYEDTTLTGSSGNTSRVDAKALTKAISSFKFLVSLVLWYDILFEINMTSKQLQAKEFDICDAINQLGETKKFLVGRRSDAAFEKTLVDAGELAEELDVPALFEPDPIHIRKKRKQFTYEADDEPIYNLKEKFKVNFYFAVIDTAIHSVEERFTLMQQISSVFGFIYDVHSLQNKTPKQIMEHCLNLEQALQHGESKDIDAFELCSKLHAIAKTSPKELITARCIELHMGK